MLFAQANPSTTQTNAALVAAKANAFVKVKSVYISSDTLLVVSLVNSATHDLKWRQYLGANGGQGFDGHLFDTILGEGVDLTTSTNGNVFIVVGYDYSN